MEFPVQTANPAKVETACLVVPVFKDGELLPAAAKLDNASERLIGQLIERGDFEATLGNVLMVPFAPGLNTDRLMLVGMGERARCQEGAFRKAVDAAFTAIAALPAEDVAVAFTDVPVADRACDWKARMVAEAAHRAVYRFDEFKTEKAPAPRLEQVTLLISEQGDADAARQGARIGDAIGQGVATTRTLGNLPGNVCTPTYLAERAEQLAAASGGALTAEILDEEALEALGAHSLLSVGRGSEQPSRLIVMKYQGAPEADEAPTCWSARASPSIPAASRSSRARRWTR